MIGFSRSNFRAVSKLMLGYADDLFAQLSGETLGDTRTVDSVAVTNSKAVAVWIEVEQESDKQPVSMTIQPGQTALLPLPQIQTYWNATRRIPGWDGLNVRWLEPAP